MKLPMHQIGIARLLPGPEFSCRVPTVVEAAIAPTTSEGCLFTAAVGVLVTPQAT